MELKEVLKNEKVIADFLSATIEESAKQEEGLPNLIKSLVGADPNHTLKNLVHCLTVTLATCQRQAVSLKTISALMLVSVRGETFKEEADKLIEEIEAAQEAERERRFKEELAAEVERTTKDTEEAAPGVAEQTNDDETGKHLPKMEVVAEGRKSGKKGGRKKKDTDGKV